MRVSIGTVAAAACALGLGLAVPVQAQPPVVTSLDVHYEVAIYHRGQLQGLYWRAGFCPVQEGEPATCANQVYADQTAEEPANKDISRISRLCGANPLVITVLPSDHGARSVTCSGNGGWEIVGTARLQDPIGRAQGHSQPVHVQIEYDFN